MNEQISATENDEHAADSDSPRKKGFLESLTAKIMGVGALFAAVAGILTHLDVIRAWISSGESGEAPSGIHAHDCIDVTAEYQPVIPYALKHNFRSSEDFYWLKLTAQNECESRFTLEVTCEPDRSDLGATCESYGGFQVNPGEVETRQIDPRLEFLAPVDEEITLLLRVRVRDQDDDGDVYNNTLTVSVLPSNTYFWELENTAQTAVLGSLAVWTVQPRGPVSKLSGQLAENFVNVDRWMEDAYDSVFERVQVVPDNRDIPPRQNRDRFLLESPEQVLEAGRANPVETALLFGALGNRVIKRFGARIILISAPSSDSMLPNIVYVGWEEEGRFQAFRTTVETGTDFEQAVRQGTEEIENEFEDIQKGLLKEDSNGVFIHPLKKRLVALDLGQAINKHRLYAGLP